ncbi:GTPase ObgE [bacterium]|nr:GTPase ObgE [bacterium]
MDFVDEVHFEVQGGRGGKGCVSFRREKYVPKGGPDGGDGGKGGDVVIKVDSRFSTLFDLRRKKLYRAGNGLHGKGKNMHGKQGKDVEIHVPPGTLVYDEENCMCLGDLKNEHEVLIVARGGKGGKGNARFASATFQAPDFSEEGLPGFRRKLRLELKLLADAGLVGWPNAGKSTLLAALSAARPKIADYPFTTLAPNLGVVTLGDYRQFVLADIPGLIPGAHLGKGLGDRFLRHIERTRVLIFMLECTDDQYLDTYSSLIRELKQFNDSLLKKPRLIVFTKIDVLTGEQKDQLPEKIDGNICFPISSISREGLELLKKGIAVHLEYHHNA